MSHFDSETVREFMTTFYGYGQLSAPCWFVGMEESGGDLNEIALRLKTWKRRGRRAIEDAAEYHLTMAETMPELGRNFRASRPVIQSTWRGLMIISLVLQGEPVDRESLRSYQRDQWSRNKGKELLLELLPLPSRNTSSWHYGELKEIRELESRARYKAELTPRRTKAIGSFIEHYRPCFVVFYGKGCLAQWEALAGGHFERSDKLPSNAIGFRRRSGMIFVALNHTIARGWSNHDFVAVGEFMNMIGNA